MANDVMRVPNQPSSAVWRAVPLGLANTLAPSRRMFATAPSCCTRSSSPAKPDELNNARRAGALMFAKLVRNVSELKASPISFC
ncbi:hypothetical protein D3C87_1353330 [compost metagenome]